MSIQFNLTKMAPPEVVGQFHAQIRAQIQKALPLANTFHELCSLGEGIFPGTILTHLRQLHVDYPSTHSQHLIANIQGKEENGGVFFEELENLLLDFDWRFERKTAEVLSSLLSEFSDVLCLGTPTVFSLLFENRRNSLLIDINNYYSEVLGVGDQFICKAVQDLNFHELREKFQAAILDPPWYLDDYFEWITAVLPAIKPGGSLFLPFYPRMLRETAVVERAVLYEMLTDIGSVSILPFEARYETPTFEAEILREIGLPPLHGWRAAELIHVRVKSSPPKVAKRPYGEFDWSRYRIGRTVVGVRSLPTKTIEDKGRQPFFLDTVSKRDPRRPYITAISSRNIATFTQETLQLGTKLSGMEKQETSHCSLDPLVTAINSLE